MNIDFELDKNLMVFFEELNHFGNQNVIRNKDKLHQTPMLSKSNRYSSATFYFMQGIKPILNDFVGFDLMSDSYDLYTFSFGLNSHDNLFQFEIEPDYSKLSDSIEYFTNMKITKFYLNFRNKLNAIRCDDNRLFYKYNVEEIVLKIIEAVDLNIYGQELKDEEYLLLKEKLQKHLEDLILEVGADSYGISVDNFLVMQYNIAKDRHMLETFIEKNFNKTEKQED